MAARGSNGTKGLEESLPSHYYTSPEIFQREKDLIFSQEWFCAGGGAPVGVAPNCGSSERTIFTLAQGPAILMPRIFSRNSSGKSRELTKPKNVRFGSALESTTRDLISVRRGSLLRRGRFE